VLRANSFCCQLSSSSSIFDLADKSGLESKKPQIDRTKRLVPLPVKKTSRTRTIKGTRDGLSQQFHNRRQQQQEVSEQAQQHRLHPEAERQEEHDTAD
jgi:hypothetical protein